MDVTPEVRSIPLGEKRKKGRPKKLPNCLVRSPIRGPVAEVELHDVEVAVSAHTAPIDVGTKRTTRKRQLSNCDGGSNKRAHVEVDGGVDPPINEHSPVQVVQLLQSQSRIAKPGLGNSKPPRKQSRKATSSTSSTALSSSSTSSNTLSSALTPDVSKPIPVVCKKKKGICTHEVVFGQHYNLSAWTKYANSIRSKKSSIDIDPDYMAT